MMNYAKPQIVALGEARRVIGFLIVIKARFIVLDVIRQTINPAYELDD